MSGYRKHSTGGRRASNRKRTGLISSIGGLIAGLIALVLVIQTGAYHAVAEGLGLPDISSVGQLFPNGASAEKHMNRIPLPDASQLMPDAAARGQHMPKISLPSLPSLTPQQAEMSQQSGGLPAAATAPISFAQALQEARALPVAAPHPDGYNRMSEFGGWGKAQGMCGKATTRDAALKRDMVNVVQDRECRVISGVLHDPYTGQSIPWHRSKVVNGRAVDNGSAAVQIDHVVALNDAWASGLYKPERAADRVRYANDMDVVLSSQGEANMVKSMGVNLRSAGVPYAYQHGGHAWKDSTPSVWLPSLKPYQCAYMAKRVFIKNKWRLAMSSWEKNETVRFLEACTAGR